MGVRQLIKTLLQKGEVPVEKTENMLSPTDLWERFGGLKEMYSDLLADIHIDSEHNFYVDNKGKSHPVTVFAKDHSRNGRMFIFLLNDPKALKVLIKKAKEKYNFDIEELQKTRNLPEKTEEMVSALDLRVKFGGRSEKHSKIMEQIYQNPEQNTYISHDGKKHPMIVKVKNESSRSIFCIVNHNKALDAYIKMVKEKYNWDILGIKVKREIPSRTKENFSLFDILKFYKVNNSAIERVMESIYENSTQNQFIDSNGKKQPIIVLRKMPKSKKHLFYVLNKEALEAFIQIAKKEYNITLEKREGISFSQLSSEKDNLPLKTKGMFSSADLRREFGEGTPTLSHAKLMETIYQDPNKNTYKDSQGKEHPIIIKVRNAYGNTFLCVSDEKGALRHFMKEFGNLCQKGRDELRSSLREITSIGNRKIISKMLSKTSRFRKKLATNLRDFLEKRALENPEEKLKRENRERGVLRKKLREASSESEKSSLVQQLILDTPERKKRADELHDLRAQNDEYIAVRAQIQKLRKKRNEYLRIRSGLKRKVRASKEKE